MTGYEVSPVIRANKDRPCALHVSGSSFSLPMPTTSHSVVRVPCKGPAVIPTSRFVSCSSVNYVSSTSRRVAMRSSSEHPCEGRQWRRSNVGTNTWAKLIGEWPLARHVRLARRIVSHGRPRFQSGFRASRPGRIDLVARATEWLSREGRPAASSCPARTARSAASVSPAIRSGRLRRSSGASLAAQDSHRLRVLAFDPACPSRPCRPSSSRLTSRR